MPTSSAGNEFFAQDSTESSSEDDAHQDLDEQMDLSPLVQNTSDYEERPMFTSPPSLTSKQKFFEYLKIVGPHIALVASVIIYLLIGASLFHYIEAPHEIGTREKQLRTIFGLKNAFQETVWNLAKSEKTALQRETFNKICNEYFEKLAVNMFEAYRTQYITERHLTNNQETKSDDQMVWSYANSFLYSTNVITTIGSGSVVPATGAGRFACIVFALFGIPLLLVTVSDIGIFIADFLKFLCKLYYSVKHSYRLLMEQPTYEEEEEESYKYERKIPIVMVLFVLLGYCGLGGLLFQRWEGWPYFDAFFFSFIAIARIGFGDLYPMETSTYIVLAYIIFGISIGTMCIDLAGTEYIRKIHYIAYKIDEDAGNFFKICGIFLKTILLKTIEFIRTIWGKLIQCLSL